MSVSAVSRQLLPPKISPPSHETLRQQERIKARIRPHYHMGLFTLKNHAAQNKNPTEEQYVQEIAQRLGEKKGVTHAWIVGALAEEPYTEETIHKKTKGAFQYTNAHMEQRAVPYRKEDIKRILEQYKQKNNLSDEDIRLVKIDIFSNNYDAFKWGQDMHLYGYSAEGLPRIPVRYHHLTTDKEGNSRYKSVKFVKIDDKDMGYTFLGNSYVFDGPMPENETVVMSPADKNLPRHRFRKSYPINHISPLDAYSHVVSSPNRKFIRFLFKDSGADILGKESARIGVMSAED